jgi:hypothetical protein
MNAARLARLIKVGKALVKPVSALVETIREAVRDNRHKKLLAERKRQAANARAWAEELAREQRAKGK